MFRLRFNLFTVLMLGMIALFIYCFFSWVCGQVVAVIDHPIEYMSEAKEALQSDHKFIRFLGAMLDQVSPGK